MRILLALGIVLAYGAISVAVGLFVSAFIKAGAARRPRLTSVNERPEPADDEDSTTAERMNFDLEQPAAHGIGIAPRRGQGTRGS